MSNGLIVRHLSLACQTEVGLDLLVSSINLSIEPGACLALVGESGSGKSLTAKAIMQLLPANIFMADASTIALDDVIISDQNEQAMCAIRGKQVGLVSQDAMSAFNPVRPIQSQFLEACPRVIQQSSSSEQIDFMADLLQQVGLKSPKALLKQYPHQLSGGMRQRALIAMAMAASPKLLIADEPTTALDILHQRTVMDLLKRLCEEQDCALLLITHDLRMAASYADDMMVMQSGRCLDEGHVRDVIDQPQSNYTRELMQAVSKPDWQLVSSQNPALRLSVKELSASYDRRPELAIDKVTFDLHAGETLAVIGASGSGKSTLGKVLMGMLPLRDGVCAYGEGMSEASIQMIFQDPLAAVDPRWLVMDILMEAYVCRPQGKSLASFNARSAMLQVLYQVGLSDNMLSRYPHACSGGELQRICIARALLMEPSILICDEPTSALDASIQKQTMALLQDLQASRGLSLIYITHDIDSLRGFAHRAMVMSQGKVVESGLMDDILNRPQADITRSLLAASWPSLHVTP